MKDFNPSAVWQTYRTEYRELIRLGAPVLLSQVGVILVSFADTLMLGAYGVKELAAAAFVNNVYLIPMIMLIGLASGITPLVGALYGRGDKKEPGRVARSGIQINLIVAVCFTALMLGLYFLLPYFGQPEEVMPLVRTYYLILLVTMIPMAIFNSCQQIANGVTDTSTPMWCMLLSIVVNILLNYLLIFGKCGFPEMGIAGAGLATLIARLSGMVMIIIILFSSKHYSSYKERFFHPGKLTELRKEVWRTSYPMMIQSGVECSLWSFGVIVCGWFGTVQLASYQVVNTIGQLGYMIYISFGVAVTIRVANYCGVHDERGAGRAARAGVHINLILATIASAIFLVGGSNLLSLFTTDAGVIEASLVLLPPLVLYQYGDAVQLTLCSAIRGTSQVKPLLIISITCYIIIGVPTLLLFAKGLGGENQGVYYSFCVALFAAAAMAYYFFKRIKVS